VIIYSEFLKKEKEKKQTANKHY